MISTTQLVARANAFMDGISDGGASQDALRRSIGELSKLRDEMLFHGFNAPFSSVLAQTRGEFEEAGEGDRRDVKKQMEKMRTLANAKKFTFNRAKVALAANRIALGIQNCGWCRKELLARLPLDGNYIGRIAENARSLHAYNELMKILGETGGVETRVEVSVEYLKDGRKARAKLSVDNGKNMEARVKAVYGEGARVVSTRVVRRADALIRRRSARVALATAYAALATDQNKHETTNARADGKAERYVEIMRRFGLEGFARIDLVDEEKYDEVKSELARSGIGKFDESAFVLDEEVRAFLAGRARRLREGSVGRARELLAFDIFRHLMLLSEAERERGAVFPGLARAGENELKFLDVLGGPEFGIKNAGAMVKRKLELEGVASIMNMNARAFGAALVCILGNKNEKWCEEKLGLPAGEVSDAVGLVRASGILREKRVGRAARFVELMKGAGDKGEKERGGREDKGRARRD
ncbi:MAG: DUF530 family protein [Candidatus Micrarchaeota archaeon]